MHLKVDVPIAVTLFYDPKSKMLQPTSVRWDGQEYPITKVGLHHTFREGRTLFHVFSVVGPQLFFRLKLNTDNLFWRLEEISDGLPD
jgi:hypothetical protein